MNELAQKIEDVKDQYHRVIIIRNTIADEYKKYCQENGIKIIDLSAKLAELTSNMPENVKEMEAWDKLKDWIDSLKDSIIAFDNIDYLFSPEIGIIDPIKEFNYYSRSKKIIILFINARRRNNNLIYSEEGNSDYKEMDISHNDGFVIGW